MDPASMKRILEEGSGTKLLLYHTDVDGICSAALFMKFFDGYRPVPMEGPIMSDGLLNAMLDEKPSVVAALDLPIDQEWKKIGKFLEKSEGTRIVIIDHHVPLRDMNSERIIHENPRFRENVYIPASVLVYRMLAGMGNDMQSLIWIAAMGVIGDYAYEDCADVLVDCEKSYPGRCKGEGSVMETLSKKLMATVIADGTEGAQKSLSLMVGMESHEEAQENGYFAKCYERVESEIAAIVSGFAEKAEVYGKVGLYIYAIQSTLNIASTVSTRIASQNPEKMIFVIKPYKDIVKVSARYQKGDISLNDLFKETSKGIGSGGGHEKAAGAVIGRKHWGEFISRVTAILAEKKGIASF